MYACRTWIPTRTVRNKFRRPSRGRANVVVPVRCVLCVNRPGLPRPCRKNARRNHELGRRAIKEKNSPVVNRRFPPKLLYKTIRNVYVQDVNTNYFIIYSRRALRDTTAAAGKFILILTFSRIGANRAHRVNGRVYFCFSFFFSKKKKILYEFIKRDNAIPSRAFVFFFVCRFPKDFFPFSFI